MIRKSTCAGCGHPLAEPFVDLGNTPLANSYVDPAHIGAEFNAPLAVVFCERCYLVQLRDLIAPEDLFSSYLYFSSFSDNYLRHAQRMADELCERLGLGAASTVLEIASNDGYLLKFFQKRGVRVLGVDPAQNIAATARGKGVATLNRFFGPDVIDELEATIGKVDVVIGNNVLAHVPEINQFLGASRDALKDGGHAVFEFPYLADLLEHGEYDTIYHEHVYYFSLSAIQQLVARAQLQLLDVSRQQVHGGSLRIFLGKNTNEAVSERVSTMLAQERAAGVQSPAHYASFGARVRQQQVAFVTLLQELKSSSNTIAAYGAPAKGNTLLNTCGVDASLIQFTVDRNQHKQNLRLPGSRIPILSPEQLLQRQPDYTVILPWNLADEIIEQQAEYIARGGRFIIPIPAPQVVAGCRKEAVA